MSTPSPSLTLRQGCDNLSDQKIQEEWWGEEEVGLGGEGGEFGDGEEGGGVDEG